MERGDLKSVFGSGKFIHARPAIVLDDGKWRQSGAPPVTLVKGSPAIILSLEAAESEKFVDEDNRPIRYIAVFAPFHGGGAGIVALDVYKIDYY